MEEEGKWKRKRIGGKALRIVSEIGRRIYNLGAYEQAFDSARRSTNSQKLRHTPLHINFRIQALGNLYRAINPTANFGHTRIEIIAILCSFWV